MKNQTQKTAEFNVNLQYEETYMIKGKKLPRIKLAEKEITLSIPYFMKNELPIAFIVSRYGEEKQNYYYYDGNFYIEKNIGTRENKRILNFDDFIKKMRNEAKQCTPYYRNYDENFIANNKTGIVDFEKAKGKLMYNMDTIICIAGYMYEVIGEPVYTYNTFGLGGNHGGTSIFIENINKKDNINKKNFTALERKECIEFVTKVALNRGDDKSIATLGNSYNIEVLMPELVTPIDRENKKEKRMKLQLCTREQSLKLKEIGFNYPTKDYYIAEEKVFLENTYSHTEMSTNNNNYSICAPTIELALQFIRNEKYIFSTIDFSAGYKWKYFAFDNKEFYAETECKFASYEDAVNDLLDELLIAIEEREECNE
jgi:hypothetical protein